MALIQRIDNFLQKHDQRILWTVSSVTTAFIGFGIIMFFWSLCHDLGDGCTPIPEWSIGVMLSSLVFYVTLMLGSAVWAYVGKWS